MSSQRESAERASGAWGERTLRESGCCDAPACGGLGHHAQRRPMLKKTPALLPCAETTAAPAVDRRTCTPTPFAAIPVHTNHLNTPPIHFQHDPKLATSPICDLIPPTPSRVHTRPNPCSHLNTLFTPTRPCSQLPQPRSTSIHNPNPTSALPHTLYVPWFTHLLAPCSHLLLLPVHTYPFPVHTSLHTSLLSGGAAVWVGWW